VNIVAGASDGGKAMMETVYVNLARSTGTLLDEEGELEQAEFGEEG